MVLVGPEYWTDELPVWPLLQRLAAGREMAGARAPGRRPRRGAPGFSQTDRTPTALGRAERLSSMNTFSATTDSEAVVTADREASGPR